MADLQRSEPSLQCLRRGPKPSWGRAFFASARLMLGQNLFSAHNSVAAAIAVALVLLVGAVVATFWTSLGDTNISPAGWIAMGFGVIVTLVLGIGLMALVFISSRFGYDELGRGSAAQPQNSETNKAHACRPDSVDAAAGFRRRSAMSEADVRSLQVKEARR